MDCNIQCCILVILVALATTCICSKQRQCLNMVTPGFTVPNGDILLEYGQPLEMFCSLYSSSKYNSSSLLFFGLGNEISKEHLSVINSTTIRLYIKKPDLQNGSYTCKLKTDGNVVGVCYNTVVVALKPQKVNDFSCVSRNWRDLNCSWIPPPSKTKTSYSLSFSVSGGKEYLRCPETSKTPNSCYWNSTTTPAYRQPFKYYKLSLDGSNNLGTNKWIYNISFFSTVIPDEPRNLSCNATTINSISIQWYIPMGLENFPPGVIHKIEYKSKYEDWQEVNTSSLCVRSKRLSECSNLFFLTINDLKYANTMYNISVRSRTGKEGQYPYRWSEAANISVFTNATLPADPPQTSVGSFEIVGTKGRSYRDIHLYWKEIPEYLENGNNFQYKIKSVEVNGINKDIVPSDINGHCASFENLTNDHYSFKIVSWNDVGPSSNCSEIVVPAANEMPSAPEQVTKIEHRNNIYQITWENSNETEIESYTVFWCRKIGGTLLPCSDLNWTVVESNINTKNITHLLQRESYEFGVSSNYKGLSSGIVWASCSIIIGRRGAEMSKVIVEHHGPKHLYVSWKIDCSNRVGVVTGFLIEYCISSNCSEDFMCTNPIKEIKISRSKRSFNITDLEPLTEYAVFISYFYGSEISSRSRTQCTKTLEGVPDMITDIVIPTVTNSSIGMKWFPPKNIYGVLLYYQIHWDGQIKNVTDTNFVIYHLKHFHEYMISVSACTSGGCGPLSNPKRVKTLMGRPGATSLIMVNQINNSVAEITWSTPNNTAGNFTYYNIEVRFVSGDTEKGGYELNATSTNASVPWKLCETSDSDTRFLVKVRTVNKLENGRVLEGMWSYSKEGPCSFAAQPTHLTVIIPLVGVLFTLLLCIFCAIFSQHIWVKFNQMRDISVKLPARLGNRQEDKSENHTVHILTNHINRDIDNINYRPPPDQQSLLKVKEEIELGHEEISNDRESFGCDIIPNNAVCGNSDSPVAETDVPTTVSPSPGYIIISPQPSGYVTFPPLAPGYMMATLPPSPNPTLPPCSILSLKQNGYNAKPYNSFPETNNIYGDMISPINST